MNTTGFMAHDLWECVMSNFNDYVGVDSLRPLHEKLGDEKSTQNELLENIINIVKELTKH